MFGVTSDVIAIVIAVVASCWVYHDAKVRKNAHPILWTCGVFLFCIVVLPLYLFFRSRKINIEKQNTADTSTTSSSVQDINSNGIKCPMCNNINKSIAIYCEHCGHRLN